jgi:hypothetical protein
LERDGRAAIARAHRALQSTPPPSLNYTSRSRALLVEGIAEALLLPPIARLHVLRNTAEAWQRFRGAVLIPIDGVDFGPYVEVLLRRVNGASIADRVVVITDRDPQLPGNRTDALETLADSIYAMVERSQLPGIVRVGRRVLVREDALIHFVGQKSMPLPEG